MTVIIVPSRPSIKSHEFTGVTKAGREISVTVTAAIDVADSAVLADLRNSMPGVSDLEAETDEDPGLLAIMGVFLFLWIVVGFAVFFVCILLGGAGFVDFYDFWPRQLPLVGDKRIGIGLFRLWVVAIPFVAIGVPLLMWLVGRKEPDNMKVGR
ncbi:hypothetical protein G6L37_06095 [Agrobacterium rubi]|nr:hypothetical protein [Agrobacterium rubi]NTF24932.1 hypothetical protein [Agrobacterium rubi]